MVSHRFVVEIEVLVRLLSFDGKVQPLVLFEACIRSRAGVGVVRSPWFCRGPGFGSQQLYGSS